MAIFKKGKDWYIDYYIQGRRKREKIGTNRKLALSVLAKRKVEIAENRYLEIHQRSRVSFDDHADEYLDFSKTNKKSWTRDRTSINNLMAFFGGMELGEITSLMIEQYKAQRKDKVKPGTVNRELSCLKHMFTKAIEWGRAKESPAKTVKLLKENNKRLRYLTTEEIQRLISACSPHLKPIVITALNTGMRKREILDLKWEDIDFHREIIFVKNTKNNEWREIPMNKVLVETLKNVKKHLDSDYVFCNIIGRPFGNVRKSFDSALKLSGIEDFLFHDLRHTFASHLVMSGADLITVKELLGHKSIRMTLRYAHLSPSHKRRAVEKMSQAMDTNMDTRKKEATEQFS